MATKQMAVSLSQYTAARALFQQHYFLADCNTDFNGQETAISWADLQAEVDCYIQDTKVTADDVALRFVICYNAGANQLYLRMQLCTLVNTAPGEYSLDTTNSAWYSVTGGQLGRTQDTALFDYDYLSNFYYCEATTCSNASLENLVQDVAEDKYVRTIVLPWGLEILPMYQANQNVDLIGFGACSFADGGSGVTYPHTLTAYLMDDSKNMLMDDSQYSNMFEMKGCDMGTLCPVHCGVYIQPY